MVSRKIARLALLIFSGFLIVSAFISCRERNTARTDQAWLDSLFEQGRALFYQTIRQEISTHPQRSQLSPTEILKIEEAQTRYGKLYEILVNVFYQKDEPIFSALLLKQDKKSRQRFAKTYLGLARFSGRMFVKAFFTTDFSTDLVRLTFVAEKPPPSHVSQQVALMAAEEQAEYF